MPILFGLTIYCKQTLSVYIGIRCYTSPFPVNVHLSSERIARFFFNLRNMDSAEAKKTYELANSVKDLLNDENALNTLRTFVKTKHLGRAEIDDLINKYQQAALLNKPGVLREENVQKLLELGLPYELDVELREAANKQVNIRPDEINVLHRIQHHCVTQIETLKDYDNFRSHLLTLIKK